MNSSVYTKSWVVELMLDLIGYVPGNNISKKIIVEPACGAGSFLISIARRLSEEVKNQGLSWNSIAESVKAYEISQESATKAIAAVTSTLVQNGCPSLFAYSIANSWIKNEDFILSKNNKCAYVVGNPPYVRSAEIDNATRKLYIESLTSFTSGCDLYISFFDKGLDMLSEDGKLCYICSDRWMQNKYGSKLRKKINNKFNLSMLIRMHDVDVFEKCVSTYPSITIISNNHSSNKLCYIDCSNELSEFDTLGIINKTNTDKIKIHEIDRPVSDEVYNLGNPEQLSYISEMTRNLPKIEDTGINIGIGIATGCDSVFIIDDCTMIEPSRLLPIFIMRDYRKNIHTKKWLINPWNDDGTLVDLEEFPLLKNYLFLHADKLKNRYIAKKNKYAWYRTIDKINKNIINRDLLLIPDLAQEPDPVLVNGYYPHHNCYWICSDTWDIHALGGIIMSETIRNFIGSKCVKMRGGTLRFQAQYLRMLHIPRYESIRNDVIHGLAQAFSMKDKKMASYYTDIAYREAL